MIARIDEEAELGLANIKRIVESVRLRLWPEGRTNFISIPRLNYVGAAADSLLP